MKVINFLLRFMDIRIENLYNEDGLTLAIRYCDDDIIETIIKSCGYTEEEVIRAYKLESIFEYIYGRYSKSKVQWEQTLRLLDLPRDTPMFDYLLPIQTSDNDINLFREDHRQALLYLRKVYGPRHVLTLQATAIALSFVNVRQNFHKIYESFSKILHSLNSKEFLQVCDQVENALREYVCNFSKEQVSIEKLFQYVQ